ncbi:PREDICTED: ATP-dependent RNA helicase ddx46 [Nicrophorus vespilloides]|uniref:ATP-dependent RNA helicase ddx46 n=1 Tax=Nicrophorus vespilloides TaxID=110193 RepID=A0ABM1MZ97_NICVS|nr:PREDICTED: ATP-dependent RNA helicase ddx46 [Nicrophorus vespilloides]
MSSTTTNPELPTPPKTRANPLDFRNTELVSRLLAATPPYLYNMPMVPNSYFFSEMLRSFVQAKTERNNAIPTNAPRRPRKRSWTQTRSEYYQKDEKHHLQQQQQHHHHQQQQQHEMPNWKPPHPPEKPMYFDNKRTEIPLELTMDVQGKPKSPEAQKMPPPPPASIVFPQETSNPNNLILPPPPPIWYPPLYPAPYGIDPLHFFIDLRVSGHIYDRKNEKDQSPQQTHEATPQPHHQPPPPPPQQPPTLPTHHQPQPETTPFAFKQSRHASAFSVPVPSKSSPINLSSREENKPLKFDVKSMGFEKCSNKTSTNYVMSNVSRIYRELGEDQMRTTYKKEETEEVVEETEEERRKRVKDLRALIGLELVVDYMNHGKPGQPPSTTTTTTADESTSDNESAASSALEVVTVQEEIINV